MANNDLEKFLAGSGLNRVWEKVFSLIKILTGDVDVNNKGTLQKQLDDVRALASGNQQGKVFPTTNDMEAWLKDSANAGLLGIGANLYIVEKDVPDWWVSGVLTEADSGTGYFYTIEPLEGKIDLSSYDTAIDKINGDIKDLSDKMTSFELTKSDIVGSGLGKALLLTASSSWAEVVAAMESVANRGNLDWSESNSTRNVEAGYYSGGSLDSRPSYNAGRSQGQADVKDNPNAHGLYTKSQYDDNWNNGYNNGRNNIRVISGTQATSGMENTTYNGNTKSKAYLSINPGGNPLLCFAYRTDHNDVAAASSSGMRFINTGGRNYNVSSNHQFDINNIHLMTPDGEAGHVWSWWCAIY